MKFLYSTKLKCQNFRKIDKHKGHLTIKLLMKIPLKKIINENGQQS